MAHLAKVAFTKAHILSLLILADDKLGGVYLASVLRQCTAKVSVNGRQPCDKRVDSTLSDSLFIFNIGLVDQHLLHTARVGRKPELACMQG